MNFELVIITNQAGIGKGFYTEQQYQTFKKHFLNILSREGIHFLAVLHCPHHIDANHKKYRKDCTYRKPNPGMVFEISKKYDVDFEKSILVGDKLSDITCGKRAGLKNLYLVRSGHPIDEIYENDISIFDDLYAVSKHMKEELGYF
jgi:D,D-heptose 1,7-bisphosphate phosphatase